MKSTWSDEGVHILTVELAATAQDPSSAKEVSSRKYRRSLFERLTQHTKVDETCSPYLLHLQVRLGLHEEGS